MNIRIRAIFCVLVAFICVIPLVSCGDDEEQIPAKVKASSTGTFIDERDGQVYNWVRYGNLEWMAQNFAYTDNNTDITIYLDYDEHETNLSSTRNLAKYGRLYSFGAAMRLCPEGWRLPTDADWQNLEQQLGMSASDVSKREWRGNIMHNMVSLYEDPCDLNLLLGGYYTTHTIMSTSGWRFMGNYGFYWTSTKDEEKAGEMYFYRKFRYNTNAVYRESMEMEGQKLSVRYVRDAR